MSKNYEKVKQWYDKGCWDIDRVKMAVEYKWITAQEFEEITGTKYEE